MTAFETLRHQIVGRVIADRQLAGNTLFLWVDTGSDKSRGWIIGLEPSWHLLSADGLLAGSMQAQDEEDASGWTRVSERIDTLVGRHIEGLHIDPLTYDLQIKLTGGLIARTFCSDPREEMSWEIRTRADNAVWEGGPRGIRLRAAT